ncbi:39S ribosomal protein L40, mitochondrial [Belonocnema kinseyi]|uniref:39S ribosomal protein L40, mitochondrial n=1 Tax=Belonocnema kinseyi TaxID=2817044 RepID=UPI00143D02AB|nr:39S ribosomal protein L40, mitochondrial [Belonocnema kinseyi]
MFSGILSSLSRLSIGNVAGTARNFTTNSLPLYFKATEPLWAEPMKRKRRLDPQILKRRVERRKKKIERAIKRLTKIAKTPKPILEMEIPPVIYKEKKIRVRNLPPVPPEIAEQRILLQKEWSHYKLKQYRQDMLTLESIQNSQEKALKNLREESEELYQAAIQCDTSFLTHEVRGPTFTPAIENYECPDGDYVDVTKKYEGE